MALKAILDTIKESSYQSNRQGIQVVREAVVSGLTTGAVNGGGGYAALLSALYAAGIPQVGDLHPLVTGCAVIGHKIAFADTDTICRVEVTYQTPTATQGGPPNQWVFRDHGTLQSVETNINPPDSTPITVYWQGPAAQVPTGPGGGTTTGLTPPKETEKAKVPYLRPMRVFSASGTFTSRPSGNILSAFGSVNSGNWQGLSSGYWLFHDYDIDTKDGGKTFQVVFQFLTRQNEDWSGYAYCLNRLRSPSPADVQGLKTQAFTSAQTQKSGITKVGLYNANSFSGLFGF